MLCADPPTRHVLHSTLLPQHSSLSHIPSSSVSHRSRQGQEVYYCLIFYLFVVPPHSGMHIMQFSSHFHFTSTHTIRSDTVIFVVHFHGMAQRETLVTCQQGRAGLLIQPRERIRSFNCCYVNTWFLSKHITIAQWHYYETATL